MSTADEQDMTTTVAIIGVACRFPDAKNPEEFWQNLVSARESIRDLSDEDLRRAGQDPRVRSMHDFVGRGVVLEDVDKFDAAFFGVNPREAEILDPQQRLFLECAWESLEDAGYDPQNGQRLIGVFAGADLPSYLFNLYNNPAVVASAGMMAIATANDKDHLTTRVAYKMDLRGPVVTVQSACSTSLVAVCQACQSLLQYQCDMVLAGGVSIFTPQGGGYVWNQGGINSKDGRCRAYDASSDGTVGGSGAGVVVLKRYEDAIADGDQVYAVIRGFGLSNDGADKVGYTAPSIDGQARAIASALAMAGVSADSISYLEGHGTGTALGDPIELAALSQVFQAETERTQFCGLGSVKSNIGHLSVASGVAGLIKTVLALKHKQLPPSLHYESPNLNLKLEQSPFFVVDRLRAWEADGPRRAGVSSFGIGGTNAHVVLEETPAIDPIAKGSGWQVLPLSAKTPTALERSTENLRRHIAETPDLRLADVAWTLAIGRRAFPFRRVLLAREDGAQGIQRCWEEIAAGDASSALAPVAFLFPGQGSQYAGMGQDLYASEPFFRAQLDECHAIVRACTSRDFNVLDPRQTEAGTDFVQPALFSLEYSLARLWMHWGIQPAAMTGHSIGEYVAACLAGVFSLRDALELVVTRGELMQSMPAGAMLSVSLDEHDLSEFLSQGLSIAALNGPSLSVLSGGLKAIERAEEELTRRALPVRRLKTSHAFHSAMMDPIVDQFVARVGRVPRQAPTIPFLSNLTGSWIKQEEAVDPLYWGKHLRQPVRFQENLKALKKASYRCLLEVGPGRVLSTLASRQGATDTTLILRSLAGAGEPEPEVPVTLQSLATLWANGAQIDWPAVHGAPRLRVSLPTYPFERQRYWIDPVTSTSAASQPGKRPMAEWFYKPVWKALPSVSRRPLTGSTLILCRDSTRASFLAALLQHGGAQITFAQQLPELSAGRIPNRIVFWWDSDAETTEGFFELLRLAQSLSNSVRALPVNLTVVTSQSRKVSSRDTVIPDNAMLAGACRVIGQELPNVRVRMMDVAHHENSLEQLAAEISSGEEPEVALRDDGRWTSTIEPIQPNTQSNATVFRRNGVYVITGGIGGMGLALAAWLSEKWQARLALIGRHVDGLSDEKLRRLEAVKEASGGCMVESVDVQDAASMRDLRSRIEERFGVIHGVLHCAGVAGGGVIPLKTAAVVEAVLAPKVAGTKALWETFADAPLDFFVLASSVNALTGGVGQIDYTAANCFLDAFAESRDAVFPVLSIDWDTWADVGMAVETEVPEAMMADRAQSLRYGIAAHEGGPALELALSLRAPRIAIAPTNLPQRIRAMHSMVAPPVPTPALSRHPRPKLKTAYIAPNGPLEQGIASLWSELFGIDEIGAEDDFLAAGGHSLLAIQLIARIREAFNVEISVATLFEEPTVRALAARLRDAGSARARLVPQDRNGRLPLSFAQQRLWFLHRRDGVSATYNIAVAFRINGELQPGVLEAALRDLAARHESLRTIFPEDAGVPYQHVLESEEFASALVVEDIDEAKIAERLRAAAATGIDIEHETPLRGFLFRLDSQSQILLLVLHHIAGDEWSLRPLLRDLEQAYESRLSGRAPYFAPLPVQYADYTLWQRAMMGDEDNPSSMASKQMSFWRDTLAGAPDAIALPFDRPRPVMPSYRGGSAPFHVDAEVHRGLQEVGRRSGASLFMVLQAALVALLARLGAGDDIPLGTPVAGRGERALEDMVGFFVNTLVLRTDASGDPDFLELVRRVRGFDVQAFGNQDLPFERVVDELAPERSASRNPLFQVMLALQNGSEADLRLGGLTLHPEPVTIPIAKFELTFHVTTSPGVFGGLFGVVEYGLDVFDFGTAERLGVWYGKVLSMVAAAPERRLHELRFLEDSARSLLLSHPADAAPRGTLSGLFAAQVRQHPEALAIEWGSERLTYGALHARSHRLARRLRAQGLRRGDLVALKRERSIAMVAWMLAIVAAGGAYLPLDPGYPAGRLEAMLADSGARVFDLPEDLEEELPDFDPDTSENDLAYVMYTSGSTGEPKGIGVPQSAIVRLVRATDYVHLGPGDRVAQVANASFDAATFEIWGALLNGAALVILDRETTLSPDLLASALRVHRIDTMFLTTALFQQIARESPSAFGPLRDLLFGGEAVDASCVRAVLDHGAPQRLLHVYGPTENTTFSTWHEVMRVDGAAVPIGRAIAHTQGYVLDAWLEPVPVGIAGELYVRGTGLAWGYVNRAARTAERFVADPYAVGERMYRTGDRVRWNAEGALEFLGRIDSQIKLRGFRIEPGEIEAALCGMEGVDQAVVVLDESASGERQLVAYVGTHAGLSEEALHDALTARLPEYMVPELYVLMEQLPLTANGKLDRRMLPEPQRHAANHEAPQTDEETILANLFAQLLHLQNIGRNDNFFKMGGHSLLATRLLSRIRSTFNVDLSVRALFEAPTVAGLAGCLRDGKRTGTKLTRGARLSKLPMSFAQQRLWFIDQLKPASCEYNMPEALRLKGPLNRRALEETVQTIVDRHESLRTHFGDDDGQPAQIIEDILRIEFPFIDLSSLDPNSRAEAVVASMRHEWQEPFDLRRGPVLRVKLLKLDEHDHIFLRTCHHIVSDGWSVSIFNREFEQLYEAFNAGNANPLRPLPIQYADFALWQHQDAHSESMRESLQYWNRELADLPARLDLPLDHPRPEHLDYTAKACVVSLPAETLEALKAFGRRHDVTLYMTLLAVISELFRRYSGQHDIVVGSPIANRQDDQLDDLIGFFVNTLVMRTKVDPTTSFTDLLGEVRRTTLDAYQHQNIPFERLVEELSPERTTNTTPLFQVIFALQNAPMVNRALHGLEISAVVGDDLRVRFDLEVHGFERPDGLDIVWIYNCGLFDGWRIQQMATHFTRLLHGALASPELPLQHLPMLEPVEIEHLLCDLGKTASTWPNCTVKALFEQQAATTPHATAVVFGDHHLTYEELNRRSNQVAHCLMELGAEPETLVGLAIDRSLEMLIALLGIVKAGCVYLPLDATLPARRLARLIALIGLRYAISSSEYRDLLHEIPHRIGLDDTARHPLHNPALPLWPESAVYANFTSGSTGDPKGVLVPHGAVVRLVQNPDYVHLDAAITIAHFAPLSFDAATFEIWGALLNGSTLVVLPPGLPTAEELGAAIERSGVNTLWLTAGLFNQVVDEALPALAGVRQLLAGGDVLSVDHVRRVMLAHPGCQIINGYGPTENTTFSCCFRLPADADFESAIPIGSPIRGTRAYVLDDRLEPVPIGVRGELYLGGAGLARGYLNHHSSTSSAFVADPFAPELGARMYRTGDVAAWRPDGALDFFGRADHQVKIRGFRIEPGEIESHLRTFPEVEDAIVTVEKHAGQKRLAAYLLERKVDTSREQTQMQQVEHWRELYESTYTESTAQDPEFDLTGWNSSYTGQPIPAHEMAIWRDQTVAQLNAVQPKRVLEIGCGTGLLLTKLAPQCERYIGLDFSHEVLAHLGQYTTTNEGLHHVELRHGLAHELAFLPDASVDLVVLNSIVQYFPDIEYLSRVLHEALRVVSPHGHIFIGDVRNLLLLDAYHASVQLHRSQPDDTLSDLRLRISHARLREEELTLDPAYFHELCRTATKAGRVEIKLKAGAYDNELSRFRYDVLLSMGEPEEVNNSARAIDWDAAGRWKSLLADALETDTRSSIVLRDVHDDRVASSVALVHLLADTSLDLKNVEAIRAAIARTEGDSNTLIHFARQYNVDLHWIGFAENAVYDAIFRPEWQSAVRTDTPPANLTRFANVPWRMPSEDGLPARLQAYLRDRLPDYMIPATFTLLAAWPLTANGKVDRKALVPSFTRPGTRSYQPPRTPYEEILCLLFAEVLEVERVGTEDNFFDLGGHSLLAMRLVTRIRRTLNVNIASQMLFEAPTVSALTHKLGVATDPAAAFRRILPLRSHGTRPPLICIHPGGGLSWCYAGLMREIAKDRPLYGIQSSGFIGDEPAPETIKAMANEYLEAILTVQPHGPYYLLGGSFGGLVAHALACLIQEKGEEVAVLAMLDSYPPEGIAEMVRPDDRDLLGYISQYLGFDLENLDGALHIDALMQGSAESGTTAPAVEVEHARRMIDVWKRHYRLCWTFTREVFRGDVLLFVAGRENHVLTPASWGEFVTGTIHVRTLDCTHNNIVQSAQMPVIGRLLETYLEGKNYDESIRRR